MLIFGHLPASHVEGFVALLMQITWVGTLGIIFAFLIPQVTSQAYLLKGVIFSAVAGFIIYTIPTLMQIPVLKETSLATVVSDLIGGAIWGLIMAKTLFLLDKKYRIT